MRFFRPTLVLLCAFIVTPTLVQAQTNDDYDALIAGGDSLLDALKPSEALEAFRAAYFARQTYEAMWKFAWAQIDVAKQLDDDDEAVRDSLFGVAHLYAEAAVRTDSLGAEGHFQLSQALGRLSRTKGGKERVRFARRIYDAAAAAIALDPTHDGAYHVLGAWHAEIRRLSGLTRFFARTFLGAGFMNRASLDSAVVHLERSVELDPDYLFHHLELAQVYLDLEREDDAVRALEEVVRRPPTSDVLDPRYQEEAGRLLEEIRNRQ
jgi:tetratricopeptide (TPR) repeat protein